ncbi:MAG TPA: hypothetical protein VJN94_17980, partial [Candidatus Binataceae bacterium]|nr:hypothetical protein [Candidatus Binataceae bacterium]
MNPFTAGMLVFLLIGVALAVIYAAIHENRRALRVRYEQVTLGLKQGPVLQDAEGTDMAGKAQAVLDWAAAQMPEATNAEAVAKISRSLTRAGFTRSGAVRMFRVIRLLSIVGGAVLGFAAGATFAHEQSKLLLFSIAGAAIGTYGPTYYLNKRGNRRRGEIARQLSDVLDLLVVCVEAGLGLFEAIRVVGEETERHGQVIGSELMLVAGEVSAGASLGNAL